MKSFFLFISLTLIHVVFAQQFSNLPVNAVVDQRQIPMANDTIDYLIIHTSEQPKPSLFFLQGSLPSPLIFDFDRFRHLNVPFDPSAILTDYHIVLISMPHTPVSVKPEHLNRQYCYVPDTSEQHQFAQAFIEANFLDNYVARTIAVLENLPQHANLIVPEAIHLTGHSQGAKIATVVAARHPQIASVSLLGFNAYGRYDEYLRKIRQEHSQGKIDETTYLAQRDHLYADWSEIVKNPDQPEHKTWLSFSINYLSYLEQINCPIYIGYGSEDLTAANCDLLPLDFIRMEKQNYTLRCYTGRDHNFFKLIDGKPDVKNGAGWTQVIADITNWTKK